MIRRFAAIVLMIIAGTGAGGQAALETPDADKPLYMDDTQPIELRVDDMVSRMTLEEKIGQMITDAPAVDRLKIAAHDWWSECLHGVAANGATVFPQAIGLASTWNTDLVHEVSSAISDEARAFHNMSGKGLSYWTPVINIARDPRWGRTQEGYGEDPYLVSRIAVAFVRGLQGDDPRYLKVVSTPKHFAVNNEEWRRHSGSATVDEQLLREYYLPHFRACIVEGKAQSVMGAYNAVNGVPCCASKMLMTDILRKEWGFDGYVVSDCGAIVDIFNGHKYVKTGEEASALAVKAGTDLNCGGGEYTKHLPDAIRKGLISEAEINTAVKRLFTARIKLGMFDPPDKVPYSRIKFPIETKTIDSDRLYTKDGKQGGLTGEYFSGKDFGTKLLERTDAGISFNWKSRSFADGMTNDNFCARWTGEIMTGPAGEYKFLTRADDGVRVWIGDKLAIDDWKSHAVTKTVAKLDLKAGTRYALKVEYFEGGIDATVELSWAEPGDKPDPADVIIDLSKRRELAQRTARESLVLLKNDGNLLPISREKIKSLAVIGPAANVCQYGNYSGSPASEPVSPLAGMEAKAGPAIKVSYEKGCDLPGEIRDRLLKVVAGTIPDGLVVPPDSKDGTTGLKGEYFDNRELKGTPALVRVDGQVDFDWKGGSPDGKIPADNFSVRWSGKIRPKKTGDYVFRVATDDGVRLYLDNKLLINNWQSRPITTNVCFAGLETGAEHELRIEYYEEAGGAAAMLGMGFRETKPADVQAAAKAAKDSDVAVVFAGVDLSVAEEENDMKDMNLPETQLRLIKEVYAANPRTVVVLLNGNPLTVNWLKENIPAIVEAWYPGQEGGAAIADVLFGDFNPGGRLPITFYRSEEELPPFDDYDIRKGRTYMYLKGPALFPFGHGLSYTTFEYGKLKIAGKKIAKDGTLKVTVDVRNTGKLDGDEVVQLYVRDIESSVRRPAKELRGFRKVRLAAGEKKTVKFVVPAADLAFYDVNSKAFVVEPGEFEVMVGRSAEDIRLTGMFEVR